MNLHLQSSSPSSILPFHATTILPYKTTVNIPSPRRRFTHLRQRSYGPHFKIVRCSIQELKFLEAGEAELLLATCITRTLHPALTLESGLEKIKDAVEELKSKPCSAKAGMYRFQIVVSSGSKSLSWFCCQDPSLGVFPQFFVSTGVENSTNKLLSFSRTRGVFGIGAAFYIKTRFSRSDPFQKIELVESDGLSILTATLAWDESSIGAYTEAFDVIIYLTTALAMPAADNCLNKSVSSVLRKFNMMVDEHAQMVYKNALLLTDGCIEYMELVSLFSWKMLHYPLSSPSDSQLLSPSPITC